MHQGWVPWTWPPPPEQSEGAAPDCVGSREVWSMSWQCPRRAGPGYDVSADVATDEGRPR